VKEELVRTLQEEQRQVSGGTYELNMAMVITLFLI
jgi:hypothetical protein